jgi:3',5'-nucleoside bisphosphate phosphatase
VISFKRADLHIHTCLSPCGDLEMSPKSIVQTACARNLDLIAISDHNTVQNVQAVIDASKNTSLVVLPAMEITSREEVHILSIFPDLMSALSIQSQIFAGLEQSQDEGYIQEQVIANGYDEVEGFCPYLLINATSFTVKRVVEMVHEADGLAIAAHIDRTAFGIINQLGFIPPSIPLDALEISRRIPMDQARIRYPEYGQYAFITNSDAHYLKDIGAVWTGMMIDTPDFDELKSALHGKEGRALSG